MSDTLAEAQATSAEPAPERVRPLHTPLQRRIRQMLIGIFLLDAGVLFVTSAIAWWYQRVVDDLWAEAPYPYHYLPFLGPGMILLWMVMLVVFGAYRVRNYGAGFEEFRA